MSYDIRLVDPVTRGVIDLDAKHQMHGGTYQVGGSTSAEMNITWNYSDHFRCTMGDDGIRAIYGMTGAESIPVLKSAINALGDDVADDYWSATEGNAKRALCGLLAFAQMRPDGIWERD